MYGTIWYESVQLYLNSFLSDTMIYVYLYILYSDNHEIEVNICNNYTRVNTVVFRIFKINFYTFLFKINLPSLKWYDLINLNFQYKKIAFYIFFLCLWLFCSAAPGQFSHLNIWYLIKRQNEKRHKSEVNVTVL